MLKSWRMKSRSLLVADCRHAVYARLISIGYHQCSPIGLCIQPVKWCKLYCRSWKASYFWQFVGKLLCSVCCCRCFCTFLQRFPNNAFRDYTRYTVLVEKSEGSSRNVWRESKLGVWEDRSPPRGPGKRPSRGSERLRPPEASPKSWSYLVNASSNLNAKLNE